MTSPAIISAALQAAISEPILGDAKPDIKPLSQEFFLRPARLSDIPTMAIHNTCAYWNSPIHHLFIAPRAAEHPEDMTRTFRQKLRRRFLAPNNMTLVACLSSDPSTVVAFSQFSRFGNDAGAKEFVRSRGLWTRIWIYILAWYFWLYDNVDNFIWKDRITDFANQKKIEIWFAKDTERYWKPYPERANRWHANSVVVGPEWQGRGIGRMLMGEVLSWAQRERVVVGLTASPHGEHLYKKLGFEMVGDFYKRVGDEGGGIMIWYPEGWEGRRRESK
jgi:GNAT superfamily N-acetyltransferase